MAVAVTNTPLSAYGTEAAVTFSAATATVSNTAEVFTITPTRPASKMVIMIKAGAATEGAVAWSIAAGATNHFGSGAADTGSVAQGTTEAIVIDTARHMSSTGTIPITLTPATGKILLTDHVASMAVVELPF
jgi:hypothetical protein